MLVAEAAAVALPEELVGPVGWSDQMVAMVKAWPERVALPLRAVTRVSTIHREPNQPPERSVLVEPVDLVSTPAAEAAEAAGTAVVVEAVAAEPLAVV